MPPVPPKKIQQPSFYLGENARPQQMSTKKLFSPSLPRTERTTSQSLYTFLKEILFKEWMERKTVSDPELTERSPSFFYARDGSRQGEREVSGIESPAIHNRLDAAAPAAAHRRKKMETVPSIACGREQLDTSIRPDYKCRWNSILLTGAFEMLCNSVSSRLLAPN